jgi:hypothetical protein
VTFIFLWYENKMVHSAATKAKISASLKAYHACARKAGCGKSNKPRPRAKPKPRAKPVPAAPRRKANDYKRHGSSRTTKRRLFAAPAAKKAPPRRRVALTTTARPATALASSLTAGQRRYRGTVLGLAQRASAMDARLTGVLF